MTVKRWCALWCDHPDCNDSDAYNLNREYAGPTKLREAARADGWTRVGRKDFCPSHRP